MKAISNKYWYRIKNKSHPELGGVWIIYFKRSNPLEGLIEDIEKFVFENNLVSAAIRKPTRDIVVIETSANRFDIYRVKNIILQKYQSKILDLQWKAGFESKEDWFNTDFPKGELKYMSKIESMIEHALQSDPQDAKRLRHKILKQCKEFMRAQLHRKINKRTKMIVEPVFGSITYDINPNQIFLIMPFSEPWSDDTFKILKDVSTENGMTLIRGDEIFSPGSIIEDIWELIIRSGLIIADITVHNPNVFYELGLAHAVGKKVVMIKKENGEKSPFDIGFWRYFEYDTEYTKAKNFKVKMSGILANYKSNVV